MRRGVSAAAVQPVVQSVCLRLVPRWCRSSVRMCRTLLHVVPVSARHTLGERAVDPHRVGSATHALRQSLGTVASPVSALRSRCRVARGREVRPRSASWVDTPTYRAHTQSLTSDNQHRSKWWEGAAVCAAHRAPLVVTSPAGRTGLRASDSSRQHGGEANSGCQRLRQGGFVPHAAMRGLSLRSCRSTPLPPRRPHRRFHTRARLAPLTIVPPTR
jgi:hypothetical protein